MSIILRSQFNLIVVSDEPTSLSSFDSCKDIRSYFISLVAGVELTDAEKLCNNRMKTVRQTIKHCYGDIENIFRICKLVDSVKLGHKMDGDDDTPTALRQLRMCHLLMNVYVCLNGNKASSHDKFNCQPPKLSDYLSL